MKWNEEKGFGWLKATELCSKDYWAEYRELDKTPMGRVLTELRVSFVNRYDEEGDWVVDVGIGGGAFCSSLTAVGIDVDPQAIGWLKKHNRLWDGGIVEVMTFWDSLEHIENPGLYLVKATQRVFLSTPIYKDEADALASKHYKPNEHCWYFTDHGIKMFMREYGFKCIDQNTLETDAGREEIGSYAFQRTS